MVGSTLASVRRLTETLVVVARDVLVDATSS
jgi:hypothetical protein